MLCGSGQLMLSLASPASASDDVATSGASTDSDLA